jgi:hypothetical protein
MAAASASAPVVDARAHTRVALQWCPLARKQWQGWRIPTAKYSLGFWKKCNEEARALEAAVRCALVRLLLAESLALSCNIRLRALACAL